MFFVQGVGMLLPWCMFTTGTLPFAHFRMPQTDVQALAKAPGKEEASLEARGNHGHSLHTHHY
jgi:hypothetical protein